MVKVAMTLRPFGVVRVHVLIEIIGIDSVIVPAPTKPMRLRRFRYQSEKQGSNRCQENQFAGSPPAGHVSLPIWAIPPAIIRKTSNHVKDGLPQEGVHQEFGLPPPNPEGSLGISSRGINFH
jgi:hypothetical protein